MKQEKWFDRKFNFNISPHTFPSIIERLSKTSLQITHRVQALPDSVLTYSVKNTWTIKENIGHLIDLEPLWQGRLEDIINGEKELRPADLQNNKTHLANHNLTPLQVLIDSFSEIRLKTINTLQTLDEDIINKSSLHPRLKIPMRTIDLFLFVAEHDDHHLARMKMLLT